MRDVKIIRSPNKPERHQHAVHQLVLGVTGKSTFGIENDFVAVVDTDNACVLSSQVEYELSSDGKSELMVIQVHEGNEMLNNDEHPDYKTFKRFFDQTRSFALDENMQNLVRLFVYEISLAPDDSTFCQSMGYSLIRCLSNREV